MKLNIVLWSVRGSNKIEKRTKVKNQLRGWKADVACLQEMKMELISLTIIRSLWNCCHVGWSYLLSKGASRGILVTWDKRVVKKTDECVGNYMVAISFKNVEDGYQWSFTGVYGPNSNTERRGLWDELAGLCSLCSFPWCIGGDFNVTCFPSK
ncbi:hypothetical protein I3760_02G199300 [Carya illinoinensis]|nr:hypothetical protein I3760_02G199300 [Carya illinoinensis]